jgi:hypothetical protein
MISKTLAKIREEIEAFWSSISYSEAFDLDVGYIDEETGTAGLIRQMFMDQYIWYMGKNSDGPYCKRENRILVHEEKIPYKFMGNELDDEGRKYHVLENGYEIYYVYPNVEIINPM